MLQWLCYHVALSTQIDSAHGLFISKHDHVQIHYPVRAAPSFLVLRHFDYNLSYVLLALLVLVCLPSMLKVEDLVHDGLQLNSFDEAVHLLISRRQSFVVSSWLSQVG